MLYEFISKPEENYERTEDAEPLFLETPNAFVLGFPFYYSEQFFQYFQSSVRREIGG